MTNRRRWWVAAGAAAFAGLAWAGCRATRVGYESPAHRVLDRDGRFELREYEPFVLAVTPMPAAASPGAGAGMDGGFGRLFRFISGDNEGSEKIAMTTPVIVERGEESGDGWMAFVVPREVAASGTPEPTGENVRLEEMAGGTFATVRFHGWRDAGSATAAIEDLEEWARSRGWRPTGEPNLAFYDPPWIPEWFRRNEVLWRVAPEP